MLSTPLLRYDVRGRDLFPSYLDTRYGGLVRLLLSHYEAFVGKPHSELERGLADHSELAHYEAKVVGGLRRVIEASVCWSVESQSPPARIRDVVFRLARRDFDLLPVDVFERAARLLKVSADELAADLYADLTSHRRLRLSGRLPDEATIISTYNLRLLQGLLRHAERLRVDVSGNVRAVYRCIKLHGLLLEVRRAESDELGMSMEITGPLALFKRTQKYGAALARVLPACCAAPRFRAEAVLRLRGRSLRLRFSHHDRILAGCRLPREFDSKLEKRFCRDFTRLGSRWEITRENQLILLGATAFLPDFTFRLRSHPTCRIDLEIVGFWTRDYLARKMAIMKRLAAHPVIFCVDQTLGCDAQNPMIPFIPFRRRVPAEDVLKVLEALAAKGRTLARPARPQPPQHFHK